MTENLTPQIRINTATVQAAIADFIAEHGRDHFTTADVARHMGVEEYPVRAAVTWLARNKVIEIVPGVRSKRYRSAGDVPVRIHGDQYSVTVYRLREMASAPVDFAALNRAFGFAC